MPIHATSPGRTGALMSLPMMDSFAEKGATGKQFSQSYGFSKKKVR
jgi:hypothetical protein